MGWGEGWGLRLLTPHLLLLLLPPPPQPRGPTPPPPKRGRRAQRKSGKRLRPRAPSPGQPQSRRSRHPMLVSIASRGQIARQRQPHGRGRGARCHTPPPSARAARASAQGAGEAARGECAPAERAAESAPAARRHNVHYARGEPLARGNRGRFRQWETGRLQSWAGDLANAHWRWAPRPGEGKMRDQDKAHAPTGQGRHGTCIDAMACAGITDCSSDSPLTPPSAADHSPGSCTRTHAFAASQKCKWPPPAHPRISRKSTRTSWQPLHHGVLDSCSIM